MFSRRGSNLHQSVVDTIGYILVETPSGFRRKLFRDYPGVENAIRSGVKSYENINDLALVIALAILTDAIDLLSDTARKKQIGRNLRVWITDK